MQLYLRRVSALHRQEFLKAVFHVSMQRSNVDAAVAGNKTSGIGSKGAEHLPSTRQVSAFKVKQTDGCVNQALNEGPFRPGDFRPQIFKHIMTREVLALIKQANSFVDSWIITQPCHSVAGFMRVLAEWICALYRPKLLSGTVRPSFPEPLHGPDDVDTFRDTSSRAAHHGGA